MKIICVACPPGTEIPEAEYPMHMATVHQGKSQREAMNEEKLKKQNTPNVIPLQKDAPLPAEFEEIAKQIDNPVPTQQPETPKSIPPSPISAPNDNRQPQPKPLTLKYVWDGTCPTCNTPVRTVITKVDGRWFASAMCLTHDVLEQKEVHPLEVARLLHDDKVKEKEVENEQRPADVSEDASNKTKMRPNKTK